MNAYTVKKKHFSPQLTAPPCIYIYAAASNGKQKPNGFYVIRTIFAHLQIEVCRLSIC
jgi:hypothetical protein